MIPSITPKGNYHPVELVYYIENSKKRGLSITDIARELNVKTHRIGYMMGDGWHLFKKRAEKFARDEVRATQ